MLEFLKEEAACSGGEHDEEGLVNRNCIRDGRGSQRRVEQIELHWRRQPQTEDGDVHSRLRSDGTIAHRRNLTRPYKV